LKNYSIEQLEIQLKNSRMAYLRALRSLKRDADNLYADASSAYENAESEMSSAYSAVETAMEYMEDISSASDSAYGLAEDLEEMIEKQDTLLIDEYGENWKENK